MIDYHRTFKQDLLREHQFIRSNPTSIIPQLDQRLAFYDDRIYFLRDNPNKAVKTAEGDTPVKELIEQLQRVPSLARQIYSEQLSKAAQDHALELSQGTEGSSKLQQRVERYTDWEGHLFQSVEFGFAEPKKLLLNLLIDDGLNNRPNRRNVLGDTAKYIGLAVRQHPKYTVVAVFVYATHLPPKYSETKTASPLPIVEPATFPRPPSLIVDDKISVFSNKFQRRSHKIVEENVEMPTMTYCTSERCLMF